MNSRILIWNTIPTVNNTPADVVIGQPNMTSNTANNGGISASSLNRPAAVKVINSKLFISDTGNSRILIWNTIPTVNNTPADVVIGQPNFTSNTANNGGISAHSLNKPYFVNEHNNKLYVADSNNNRILIFNNIPETNQVDADLVLGQPNMTSNTANNGGISAHSLNVPTEASVIENKLYVTDMSNNRILIFNNLPTANQVDADLVLGQKNMTRNKLSDGGDDVFNYPFHTITPDGKLIVVDGYNNRVLIWNTIPTTKYPLSPDYILGQPDMNTTTANTGGVSANSFNYPRSPAICGNKLIVVDYANQRVLIWNTIPTASNTPADVVIGQPNMTSNTTNNGGRSAHSLYYPSGSYCYGNGLAVSDYGNKRILIFNTIPETNQADANLVLGQPDFISATTNNGGLSAHSIYDYTEVYSNGTNLFVSDSQNQRLLIWRTTPTINNQNADVVLGQPDFISNSINNGGLSNKSLYYPTGMNSDGTRLFVADRGNHRILGWNTIPDTNFASADFVIGQPDFTSALNLIGINRLTSPNTVSFYNNKISVSDTNNRINFFPFGPQDAAAIVPTYVNDKDVSITLSAEGAKDVKVSENSSLSDTSWVPYSNTIVATVSDTEGTKNIYVKFQDYANYESGVLSATTVLDKTAPVAEDFAINNNSLYTFSQTIKIYVDGTDTYSPITEMMISEDPNLVGASWEPYATTKNYTLSSSTPGERTMYIKFKDAAGNISSIFSDPIILDTVTANHTVAAPSPTALLQDLATGYISVASTSPTSTENFSFNVDYVISADIATVEFPAGTVVTKTGGGTLDVTSFVTNNNSQEVKMN